MSGQTQETKLTNIANGRGRESVAKVHINSTLHNDQPVEKTGLDNNINDTVSENDTKVETISKPKTAKPKTVKPKTAKPKTVKPKTVKTKSTKINQEDDNNSDGNNYLNGNNDQEDNNEPEVVTNSDVDDNESDALLKQIVSPTVVAPIKQKLPEHLLLEIATVQVGPIKILIDGLKDYLLDCNIEVIPIKDGNEASAGLKILALNHKEGMLVHVKLHASGFNVFNCEQKQVLGINMQSLHKIIRSMGNSDILTLRRFSDCQLRNKLNLAIENMEKKQKFEYNLQLMDIGREMLDITSAKFQAVIVMCSSDFQKACRDMNGIESKLLEITLIDNVFRMKGNGEIASGQAEFRDTKDNTSSITIKRKYEIDGVEPGNDKDEIIHGTYDLKN